MSFLVCHVQKFKSPDVRGMQIHNQRESKNSKNKEIDIERSHLNIDLVNEGSINYNKKVKQIIEKGYKGTKAIRKDAVVMNSTLISSDREFFKDMPREKQLEFFKESLNYLSEKYGEDNIVSATVHFDETTPHMHVCSVPLTSDGKLSAKTIFNRTMLKKLQTELPKHLQEKGFNINRGVEGSERGHVEVNEFKKLTKYEEVKALEEEIKLKEEILKDKIKEMNNDKIIDEIKVKKLGKIATISSEDLGQLKDMAKMYKALESENKALKHDLKITNDKLEQYPLVVKNLTKSEKEKDNLKANLDKAKDSYNDLVKEYNDLVKRSNRNIKELKEYKDVNLKQGKDIKDLLKVTNKLRKNNKNISSNYKELLDLTNKTIKNFKSDERIPTDDTIYKVMKKDIESFNKNRKNVDDIKLCEPEIEFQNQKSRNLDFGLER